MWWTIEKLAARIKELAELRYRDEQTIGSFVCQEDAAGEIGTFPPETGPWRPIRLGDTWEGRDRYVWLAADVSIPGAWSGRTIAGFFDFGRTGGGNNSGFESLLFVNGQPYQGVDSNHKEVFLPEDSAGKELRLHFRLWSGLNGYGARASIEHRLLASRLGWLDEATDDLVYTSRAVLETIQSLDVNRPEREELLEWLDRVFLGIDWSYPRSEAFYRSVAAARDTLAGVLSRMPKHHTVKITCVGHTHIDVAWLWRLAHTREKTARSFSTVLRLMEQYPEYMFMQTQPQLYEYLKRDYPQLYESIRQRVKEGRWEPGGAMWLEADCNLPSGESLVRQLLYGKQFLQSEFGVDCRYLWLPDVFGYCWAMPQILRKAGIEAFMTTKISWNQYNRMPHDTFLWRGMDGSEIVTHFITTPTNDQDEETFQYTYNGEITAHSVQGIWNGYRDKGMNRHLLLAYGYGDGGGGPTRDMLEMRRRFENMPGLPAVETGRADAYFEKLVETVNSSERYVHVWDGELYLEAHRGTYTSQAYNKRMNRRLELLYRDAEWLCSMQSVRSGSANEYPAGPLLAGWKIILRNQFHDIIPGSSIAEVYEDSRLEYEEAERLGTGLRTAAAEALTRSGDDQPSYTVFNNAGWERSDVAVIPARAGMEGGTWRTRDGRRLAAERSGDSWLVRVERLPSMGAATIHFQPSAEPGEQAEGPAVFEYAEGRLDTPFYRIEWNKYGALTVLYDKRSQRSVLAPGAEGNVLQVFEDKPKGRHEAWDIDIFYGEKKRTVNELVSACPVHSGSLRFAVRFHWKYGRSDIVQELIVYRDSPRIDFRTEADWQERRQLLKAAFPVDVRSTEATYDVQFGNVKRPTHWNTSWDYARFETVGHQWADLSEHGYGVSLLNDCKYGYDIKDNVMRLSLIKSAMVPDELADLGYHEFTYSLLPHSGDWRSAGTVREAWALNNPLTVSTGELEGADVSMFRLDADHVWIDAVKQAEQTDEIVVRLHEYTGSRGTVTVRSDFPIVSWQETDLLEEPAGERREESIIRLDMKPYEIRTVVIAFGLKPMNE